MPTSKYDAFISYSHAADSQLAEALERALQRFAKPVFKLRGMRVFRDQSDLSLAPHLWGDIQEALSDSDHFLLLASPESAGSSWVSQELEHWIETKGAETIFIVQTDGEIVWDNAVGDYDWAKTTSLPEVLKGAFVGEPLYLDLRWARAEPELSLDDDRFTRSVAQVVAAIRGRAVEDVYGEELQRHKKTVRLRNGAIALLTVLTVASLIAAVVAVNQSRIATAQRNRAEGLNEDLKEQIVLTTQERDRANEAAEAEREARIATEQQLEFIIQVLSEQFAMRDQIRGGPGTLLTLRVFFGFEQDRLPENAFPLLDRLVGFLRANPSVRVLVAGHFAEFDPDGAPTDSYALGISQRRANSVRGYLVSRGVGAQQVNIIARGKGRPLIRATNPEARVNELVRRMNSRAEVYAVVP